MIPKRILKKRGKCAITLSATVLCSLVPLAFAGTVRLEQTPAQDRSFLDNIFGGWSSPPPGPSAGAPMNIPDVAGFGMYPLWKFHKFDGLSLRPVPYGVDIGSGIPPSPSPPAYPTGFLSSPQSSNSQAPYYGPPSNPPSSNYESSSAPAGQSQSQSYDNSAPAQGYGSGGGGGGNSAPQQGYGNGNSQSQPQQQSYGGQYGMASVPSPSYQQPNQPNYNQQSANQVPYTPSAPKYNDGPQVYNAPPMPQYGEAQSYGPPQSNYGGQMNGGQMNGGYGGADPYASPGGITIQFAPVPQEYGMQQQQQPSNYGGMPSGSYQVPAYSAIESPMSAQYPPMQESKPLSLESGYGGGGFLKRSSTTFDKDTPIKTEPEGGKDSSYMA